MYVSDLNFRWVFVRCFFVHSLQAWPKWTNNITHDFVCCLFFVHDKQWIWFTRFQFKQKKIQIELLAIERWKRKGEGEKGERASARWSYWGKRVLTLIFETKRIRKRTQQKAKRKWNKKHSYQIGLCLSCGLSKMPFLFGAVLACVDAKMTESVLKLFGKSVNFRFFLHFRHCSKV